MNRILSVILVQFLFSGYIDALTLTSSAFSDGGIIPTPFTYKLGSQCNGNNWSPPLSFGDIPVGTASFSIRVVDPDGGNFVHWSASGIPGSTRSLPYNASATATFSQSNNSFGTVGWGGPCPPTPNHHYVFTLSSLDSNGLTLQSATLTGIRSPDSNVPWSPYYAISVTNPGNGTITSSPSGISCGSTCSANFDTGSSVTLTATPTAGYAFSGWSGGCTGTSACVINLNSNQSVSANFSAVPTPTPTPTPVAPKYNFTGFYPPVSSSSINSFKKGAIVKFAFGLKDRSGLVVSSPASVVSRSYNVIDCNTYKNKSDINPSPFKVTPVKWNKATKRLEFSWTTPKTANVCVKLNMVLDGGQVESANLYLKN